MQVSHNEVASREPYVCLLTLYMWYMCMYECIHVEGADIDVGESSFVTILSMIFHQLGFINSARLAGPEISRDPKITLTRYTQHTPPRPAF